MTDFFRQWSGNKFLKVNSGGTRQGRKLNVKKREKKLKPKGIFNKKYYKTQF